MRPPCSGAVASTSAASAPLPSLGRRRFRRASSPSSPMHHHSSVPSPQLPRSLRASAAAAAAAAMTGDRCVSLRDAARRPALHKRSNPRPMMRRQPSSPISSTSAAASSASSGYTPPPPVNYFESDAFVASPPPPESLTRPAFNRYRATIDVERSTVAGWEAVVPSAGDPDWQPPPVDFKTLAAYPLPWLRFKILPKQLTFVVAELWSNVLVPLWQSLRRSWVVSGAAAVDRRVFGGGARRRRTSSSSSSVASSPSSSASSSSSASASSLSPLELALLRWHGKRSPLDDLREWLLALRGK